MVAYKRDALNFEYSEWCIRVQAQENLKPTCLDVPNAAGTRNQKPWQNAAAAHMVKQHWESLVKVHSTTSS